MHCGAHYGVFLIVSLLAFVACGSPEKPTVKVYEITAIAGKSFEEVVRTLGPPEDNSTVEIKGAGCPGDTCPQYTFRSGEFEIVFIDDVADLIRIFPTQEIPLQEDVLAALGLPPDRPNNWRSGGNVWTNVGGIRLIHVSTDSLNRVSYFYLRTNTLLLNFDAR